MADKQIEVEIITKADLADLDSLESKINEIQSVFGEGVNVKAVVDGVEVDDLSSKVEELEGKSVQLNIETDNGEITEAQAIVGGLDGTVTQINLDVDSSSVDDIQSQLDSMGDVDIAANIDIEGSELDNIISEMDSLSDVDLTINVDSENVEDIGTVIDELNGKFVQVNIETDNGEITDAQTIIESIDGTVTQITLDIDSTALEDVQAQLDSFEDIDVAVNIDGTGVDDLVSGLDSVAAAADDATESVGGLQDSMGLFEAGALMGISGELSNMGASAEGAAQEMNTAAISVGQLATNVGMAEPQMISLINNISNATFPQSEAMAYVGALKQMGVSAENLGSSATNMDRINDATHIGYGNVMQLTAGLKSMGISADNLPSAFNALGYAEANVFNGASTLQGLLKTQAGTLNEYGLSVDQTVILLGALQNQTGLTGRKLNTELAARLKECNGDVSALEQSVGLANGTLQNASQITGEYAGRIDELAAQEAEHKTWLDQIGAAYEDLTLSMSPVLSPLASFMGLIGQAGSYAVAVNGLFKLWDNYKNLGGISGIVGHVRNFGTTLTNTASTMRNAASTAANFGKTLAVNVANGARTALVSVANFARTLATSVLSAAKNAALAMKDLAISVLTTGYNALKSAAMWVAEKAAMVASTIAEYAATAAQWALNVAMSANPIGILIVAIGLLVAALGYLYFNNEQVKGAIDGLGQTFMNVGQIIYGGFLSALQWVQDGLTNLWNYIVQVGTMIWDTVTNVVNTIVSAVQTGWNMIWNAGVTVTNNIMTGLQNLWNYIMTLGGLIPANASITGNKVIDSALKVILFIGTMPMQLAMHFTNMIAKALGFGNNFSQRLISGATNAVNGFINKIRELPGMIQTEFARIGNIVSNFVTSLPQRVWDLGASIVGALKSALGIGSPGYMYWMFEGELTRLKNAPEDMAGGITKSVHDLGTSMVDSFNPELSYDVSGNASLINAVESGSSARFGDVIINVGSVDNEDRIQEIVTAVRRELNWNNLTAGRSV